MNRDEARREDIWIWTAVMIVVVLIGLAIYGYVTGAWEAPPE